MKIGQNFYQPTKCGYCLGCRIDKRQELQDRSEFELYTSKGVGSFVTLTFDDEYFGDNPSVSKDDTKGFCDRLRYNLKQQHGTDYRYKFLIAGEYGDLFQRKHYHAILFNVDSELDFLSISKAWHFGFIKVKPAAPWNIRYTVKYLEKDQVRFGKDKTLENGLRAPFHTFSKGLGREYMYQHKDDMIANRGYYQRGKLRPLPRYYAELLGVVNSNPLYYKKYLDNIEKEDLDLTKERSYYNSVREFELEMKDALNSKF